MQHSSPSTLFIILSTYMVQVSNSNNMKYGCTKNIEILEPNPVVQNITGHVYKASITEYPKTIKVYSTHRSRWTNYCYDGGFLDSNTGCIGNMKTMHPTKEEAKEWRTRNKCKIGHQCYPDGNCWGSDSEKCLTDELNTWVERAEHHSLGTRWQLFSHHTCLSSWRCFQHSSDLEIILQREGKSQYTGMISLPNGTMTSIWRLDGLLIKDPEEILLYLLNEPKPQTISQENLYCLTKQRSIKCMFQENSIVGKGITITIDPEDMCGAYFNFLVCLSNHEEIEKIKTQSVPKSNINLMSASIYTLRKTTTEIQYEQLQSQYNILEAASRINELQTVITRMIKSLSKKDPDLIGQILGTDVRTNWYNSKYVKLCKSNTPISSLTNCKKDTIFKNGEIRSKTKGDVCTSISVNDIMNLTFFKDTNLDLRTITSAAFQVAHEDIFGWAWTRDLSFKPSNVLSPSNGDVGSSNILSSGESFNLLEGLYKWFIALTAPVSWFTFFIVICRRR